MLPSLAELPTVPDMAIITVPAESVVGVVRDSIAAAVPNVVSEIPISPTTDAGIVALYSPVRNQMYKYAYTANIVHNATCTRDRL